jgi:hypothetical protein
MRYQVCLGSAALLLVAARASGSPDPTVEFRDLVARSDAVVVADVVESTAGAGRTVATATTVEILRGIAPRRLTVTWADTTYLRIDGRGRYVLFLETKSDGTFAPGAGWWSFWKVLPRVGAPIGCNIAVDYTYLIDQIRGLERAKVDVIDTTRNKPGKLFTIICVDRLRQQLASQGAG